MDEEFEDILEVLLGNFTLEAVDRALNGSVGQDLEDVEVVETVMHTWNLILALLTLLGTSWMAYSFFRFLNLKVIPYFLLLHLALAHVLFALSQPISATLHVERLSMSLGGCRLFQALLHHYGTPRRWFLLLLISDRFLAIVDTPQARNLRTIKNARISACAVWGLTLVEALARAFMAQVEENSGACWTEYPYIFPYSRVNHFFVASTMPAIIFVTMSLCAYEQYKKSGSIPNQLLVPPANEEDHAEMNKLVFLMGAMYLVLGFPIWVLESFGVTVGLTDAHFWFFVFLALVGDLEIVLKPVFCFLLCRDFKKAMLRAFQSGGSRVATKPASNKDDDTEYPDEDPGDRIP